MTNMRTKIKIVISWILVIIWASVIFYLSSRTAADSTVQSRGLINSFTGLLGFFIQNEETLTRVDGIVRESAHGVEYLILGIFVFNALYTTLNYRFRALNCFICSWLICCIYAITDELHQIPVPGRTFQVLDLVIDFAGSVIGIIAVYILFTVLKKSKKH